MTAPLVSVITNSYNAARFLRRHIESLVRQSFESWEHIVVDCGLTDGSIDLLRSEAHPKLRLLQVPFCGVAKGRSLGIAEARGRIVAILDADDFALPERLSSPVRLLEERPEVVACGGCVVHVDERSGRARTFRYPPEHRPLLRLLQAAVNVIPHSTLTFRRSAYDQVGGYSEVFEKCEDFEFLLRLARVGQLASVPARLAWCTIHGDSHSFLHRPMGRDARYYVMLAVLLHARDGRPGAHVPSVAAIMNWLDHVGPDGARALCARWAVPGAIMATVEGDGASLRYYVSALLHWGRAMARHRRDAWWSTSASPEQLAALLARGETSTSSRDALREAGARET